MITCILVFCDINDGLSRLHLKVLGLCWLTSAVHCGAVPINPFHTIIVLTVTLGPAYDVWAKSLEQGKDASQSASNKGKQLNRNTSASPSSPSSVPLEEAKAKVSGDDLPMF